MWMSRSPCVGLYLMLATDDLSSKEISSVSAASKAEILNIYSTYAIYLYNFIMTWSSTFINNLKYATWNRYTTPNHQGSYSQL